MMQLIETRLSHLFISPPSSSSDIIMMISGRDSTSFQQRPKCSKYSTYSTEIQSRIIHYKEEKYSAQNSFFINNIGGIRPQTLKVCDMVQVERYYSVL